MAFGLHTPPTVSIARATACHYCPRWLTALWLSLGLIVLVLGSGCRRAVASPDTTPKSPEVESTITGTVRAPEGASPIAGRTLAIVNVATGQRRTIQTTSTGAFTVAVPAGRYRVEMALRDGEALVKRPEIVDLDRGDADAHVEHVEFVLGPSHVVRPRGPAYRIENGLGSPIA